MFQLMKKIVIGNNNPLNHKAPDEQKIKTINKIELALPDLNVKSGNLIKCIGLIIKKQTNDKSIIEVRGSP